jgi:hypothetical protein
MIKGNDHYNPSLQKRKLKGPIGKESDQSFTGSRNNAHMMH